MVNIFVFTPVELKFVFCSPLIITNYAPILNKQKIKNEYTRDIKYFPSIVSMVGLRTVNTKHVLK